MPIATLRYTLPEEAMEHRAALAGVDALVALETIDQWARGKLKYGSPSEAEEKLLQELRAMILPELREILE